MRKKIRMWFGIITVLALSLVMIDFYDLRGRAQEWCDQADTLCGKTRFLLNVPRVKYLRSCEGCLLAGVDFSFLNLSGVNFRGANLKDAKFKRAVLQGANLSDSIAHRAEFDLADLSNSNLSGADLDGCDFSGANLTNAVLTGADIKDASLKGAILSSVDLQSAKLHRSDLTDTTLTDAKLKGAVFERAYLGKAVFEYSGKLEANFSDAIMRGANLQGQDLSNSVLQRADLSQANLSRARLGGANLQRAYLEHADLSGADLSEANLTDAYLYGADMSDSNMEGAVLTGARFSGADLRGATMRHAQQDLTWSAHSAQGDKAVIEKGRLISLVVNGLITSIVPNQGGWLLTTQSGAVLKLTGGRVSQVFDLSGIRTFVAGGESGLLSIATHRDLYYLAYTLLEKEGKKITTLVVNEYTKDFDLVRTIARIEFPTTWHHGGTLDFDGKGNLYLATGDGEGRDPQNLAQNRDMLQGKVLRFDIAQDDPEPEIVAYGLRNPWKFSIDKRGRMFVGDVGGIWREEVNLIGDLYSRNTPNYGHRVFEGSRRVTQDPIEFVETIPAILEYEHHRGTGRPISVIGGYYLDDFSIYIFAGMSGFLRVLKESRTIQGDDSVVWREVHYEKVPFMPTTFGYDGEGQLLVAGIQDFATRKSVIYDLTITKAALQQLPWSRFCETEMPDGLIRNDHCTE